MLTAAALLSAEFRLVSAAYTSRTTPVRSDGRTPKVGDTGATNAGIAACGYRVLISAYA